MLWLGMKGSQIKSFTSFRFINEKTRKNRSQLKKPKKKMCKSFKCNKNVLFPLKRINGVFFRKINSKWFLYINEWIAGLQEGLIRNNAIKFRFSRLVQPWLVRARAGGERSWWRKSHCTEVRQRGNCNYTAGNWLEERDNNSLQIIGEKLSQVSALANVFHF